MEWNSMSAGSSGFIGSSKTILFSLGELGNNWNT
jgi:hypothetical protein